MPMDEYNIYLTAKAILAVRELLKKKEIPDAFMRFGVSGGGCVGFKYVFQIADDVPSEKDHQFLFEDVRVLVDNKSINYLNECTIDWRKSLITQGFTFLNPNARSYCGCGISFTVEEK